MREAVRPFGAGAPTQLLVALKEGPELLDEPRAVTAVAIAYAPRFHDRTMSM